MERKRWGGLQTGKDGERQGRRKYGEGWRDRERRERENVCTRLPSVIGFFYSLPWFKCYNIP